MQNLVTVSPIMEVPKFWGRWVSTPVIGVVVNPQETHLSSICYCAEFGRSTSNRMGVRRNAGGSKIEGCWSPAPLGWEAWSPTCDLLTIDLRHTVYGVHGNFGP